MEPKINGIYRKQLQTKPSKPQPTPLNSFFQLIGSQIVVIQSIIDVHVTQNRICLCFILTLPPAYLYLKFMTENRIFSKIMINKKL